MSDLIFTEQGAGTTPSAGKHTVYYKTDGKLYTKDTTGTEISLPTLTEIAAAVLTLTNKTLTSPVINGFSGTGNGAMTGNLAVTGTLSANGLTVIGSTPTFSPTVGTDAALLRFNNTGTGDVFVGKDNSAGSGFGGGVAYSANLYNGGNTPMIFWTNGVQRMQIGASGGLAVTGALSATGTTLLGGTTDSASGSKTQSPSFEVRAAGSDSFQQGLFFGGSASTGNIQAGGVADALDVWTFAGAWGKRARFSSTGFAVTGAINTTGTISATTPEGLRVIDADPYVSFFNAANTVRRGYIQANATSSRLTIAAESTLTSIQSLIGSAVVTSVSSTGLAVTGTLSASNELKVSGANQINAAARVVLSYEGGGNSYIQPYGVDNATPGVLVVRPQSANGSVGNTVATFSPTGLAVTGALSATGAISSNLQINIVKDGADTIGDGPFVQLRNAANTRSWVQQLSASNNMDWWYYNGAWAKSMTLSLTGLAVTGALSATGNVSGAGLVISTLNAALNTVYLTGGYSVPTSGYGSRIGFESFASNNYAAAITFEQATGLNVFVERMRLDTSGNLGLGVTPGAWGSQWKALQIKSGALYASDAYTIVSANMVGQSGSDSYFVSGAQATRYLQVSGQHQWQTAPSGTAGNAITFTQAMTLDASGNLSVIGTSTAKQIRSKQGTQVATWANGATKTLMTLPAGSWGANIAGTLSIECRDDVGGNLTCSTYLLSAYGGTAAISFAAVSTLNFSAGQAFTIAATSASGSLEIVITNTSGRSATSVNFTFSALKDPGITYSF